MSQSLFDAARSADLAAVRACLEQGADPGATDAHGFTALHGAAMACNAHDDAQVIPVIEALLQAGCPLELASGDGRTALYLAAEFAQTVAPVRLLLEHGANADVSDGHGNHVVVNAMLPEVQALLAQASGRPVPAPPLKLPSVRMTPAQWRAVKLRLDRVFDELGREGLIALQDAGTTQEDGFADCAEAWHARGGLAAGWTGFCFYTRQDLNRAKRSSQLALAFWGAPEGETEACQRVGEQVVQALRRSGFLVDWGGSAQQRPVVGLQGAGDAHPV